jgi:murein DD-endopeptidase MepM/ murein hydrolase activator NlpD
MKKVKYFYNTNTLRYEKLETPLHTKLLRVIGFLAASAVTALIIVSIAFNFLDSPKERVLRTKYETAKQDIDLLSVEVKKIEQQMSELEGRDKELYRSIFEANPLPDSARAKRIEAERRNLNVRNMSYSELGSSIRNSLNNLIARVSFQEKSYKEILELMKNKEEKLACMPYLQPVRIHDMKRLASGFGIRNHPTLHTRAMHWGLDFAAGQGSPIYATGNGVVKFSGANPSGYGNHVIINHGYGYESLYAHMLKIKAVNGQRVKRGDLIGWVGSTGRSTGPHLHYEIRINGEKINPVYFIFKDLSPEKYAELLKQSENNTESFDF